jgi:hypothetical protein
MPDFRWSRYGPGGDGPFDPPARQPPLEKECRQREAFGWIHQRPRG